MDRRADASSSSREASRRSLNGGSEATFPCGFHPVPDAQRWRGDVLADVLPFAPTEPETGRRLRIVLLKK